jgi:hypothetical protein
MNKQILKIAKKVRKIAHTFAMSPDSYRLDFHDRSDLRAMCAVASFALYNRLKNEGYDCVFVSGKFKDWNDHCWVEIDGCIVDITATQFGIEEDIFITPDYDDRYKPFNKRSKRKNIDNVSSLRKSGWPKSQVPSWKKIEKYFEDNYA